MTRSKDRAARPPGARGCGRLTGRAVQATESGPVWPPVTCETVMAGAAWQPSMPLSHSRSHTWVRGAVPVLANETCSRPRHTTPCAPVRSEIR